MSSLGQDIFTRKGSIVLYHREGEHVPCPCRTPEGYRDPAWHKANPNEPECNEAGFIIEPIEKYIKGFVQPAATGRNAAQTITEFFGEIRSDDHLGFFPLTATDGTPIEFENWSRATDEYIEYNGRRFTVIGAVLIPDPRFPGQDHHFECALRRINKDEPGTGKGF